jgi:phage shock protein E
MLKRTLLLLTLLLIIAGCSSNTAAPAIGEDIDLSTLQTELDVQTVADLKDRDDVLLVDVRELWEYEESHIPGITLIPMAEVPNRLDEIPTDKEVILTCRSGNRSGQVAEYLQQQGFDNVHNMLGGILAWQAAGLPVEP